jgi:hypothetical protein
MTACTLNGQAGICCNQDCKVGGNCCNDNDCKDASGKYRYDPVSHTKIVCDSPSGSYEPKQNTYTCRAKPSCSVPEDCDDTCAVIKTQPYHLLVRELVVVWRGAQEGVITNIFATRQKDLILRINN